LRLGQIANIVRYRKNPEKQVTFVLDSNPNYTNICSTQCSFCAFYRSNDSKEAYVLTVDELIQKFRKAANAGITTILLQGGVNSALDFSYYLDLVRRTRQDIPSVHPHFFSPPEIIGMSKKSGSSIETVLRELKKCGLDTIPGGGAEILCERIRSRISPQKSSSDEWLQVMKLAHTLGFTTTATMMFGHLEESEDIIEHLSRIRRLQDETGGFSAFIPWSFKHGSTPLGLKLRNENVQKQTLLYIQILALSRIFLDNFSHIQASWFSEGKRLGQVALHYGADDFGGILFEENVHKSADFINSADIEELKYLIRRAGFTPAQRTTKYEILKIFA
jgi:cyclic dehypoxanthinyl futalosine synthase